MTAFRTLRGALLITAALGSALPVSLFVATPAQAIIVYDPTNFAQNLLQAVRALQQINNQIASLHNEAQMLMNEARNLTSLPYSALAQIQDTIRQTQSLLGEAQRIAYSVREIDKAFSTTYAPANLSDTDKALIGNARARWQTTVAGFQDALRVQAGAVGNLENSRSEMTALVTASQSATGALQAAQAGNQILALQAQQLADLTAVVAAQGRAQALEAAQAAAASDQAREQLRRFLTPGGGYEPGNAKMFHD